MKTAISPVKRVVAIVIMMAVLIIMGTWTSMAADKVDRLYHYVGHEFDFSGSEFITLFNFNPDSDARVRIEVTDHRGLSRFQFLVPKGSHLVLGTPDLGITDLYYMQIRSNRPLAVSVIETYFATEKDEMGGVTPQAELFSSYALANASGSPHDDFFRIFAPVTPTTIEFYDQDLNLLATRTITGNGLAEFKASDLGYSDFWSAYIKAADGTPNPFAISFLEGPSIAFLIIPQGIR